MRPLPGISFAISLLLICFGLVNGQPENTRDRLTQSQLQLARQACLPAHITVGKTMLCSGESLDLRSADDPAYIYRWFKDGAVIIGEKASLLTINAPGTYKLEVTNTAALNCVQTDEVTIRQSVLKKVSLLPLTQQVACAGGSLVAAIDAGTTNPASASLTYNWQRNGVALPGNGPTLQASEPGTYTVFVADGFCQVSAGPVDVFGQPKPEFPAIPAVCLGSTDQVVLKASPTGGVFSGKGVQNGRFMAQQAGPGEHILTYSVSSANGCQASVSQPVRVINVPQPDLGPNQTIIAGMQVVLQGPPGPNLTYTWDPIVGLLTDGTTDNSGGRLNLQRVIAQPAATTTYDLTVSENSECPLTSSVTITVVPGLFFPSAFTPNGDGQNDVWTITGLDAFPHCSVRIYNRWGELIVSESPYSRPWDGRVRGERVPPGPYRYVVSPAPFMPERSGTLTVLD